MIKNQFCAASNLHAYPSGRILRLRASPFLHGQYGNSESTILMFNLNEAFRIQQKFPVWHENLENSFSIVTTTMADRQLCQLTWEQEVKFVSEFQPCYYIPSDVPTYLTQNANTRRFYILESGNSALNIVKTLKRIPENHAQIIPLIKGTNHEEFTLSYSLFKLHGFHYFAYYCAQYFIYGRRSNQLIEDVRDILRIIGNDSLLLIGVGSQNILRNFQGKIQSFASYNRTSKKNIPSGEYQTILFEHWR